MRPLCRCAHLADTDGDAIGGWVAEDAAIYRSAVRPTERSLTRLRCDAATLPDCMVPSVFMLLDDLPLTDGA